MYRRSRDGIATRDESHAIHHYASDDIRSAGRDSGQDHHHNNSHVPGSPRSRRWITRDVINPTSLGHFGSWLSGPPLAGRIKLKPATSAPSRSSRLSGIAIWQAAIDESPEREKAGEENSPHLRPAYQGRGRCFRISAFNSICRATASNVASSCNPAVNVQQRGRSCGLMSAITTGNVIEGWPVRLEIPRSLPPT